MGRAMAARMISNCLALTVRNRRHPNAAPLKAPGLTHVDKECNFATLLKASVGELAFDHMATEHPGEP